MAINAIQESATRSLFALSLSFDTVIFCHSTDLNKLGCDLYRNDPVVVRFTSKLLESVNEIIVQIEEEKLLVQRVKSWLFVISCKA